MLSVPQEPPQWIQARVNINITLNIFVQWPAIPSHKVEGRLLGYRVFYRVGNGEFSSKTVGPDVNETSINIANVPVPYEIRVAGFTNGGLGPMSRPQQVTSKAPDGNWERLSFIRTPPVCKWNISVLPN